MLSKRCRTAAMLLVFGVGLTGGTTAHAQPVPGIPNFSGTWVLNSYLTDHPEQMARALQIDTGQWRDQELPAGGTERGRSGGTGHGGQGGASAPRADQISAEDQKKIEELTHAVRFAPSTMTISQSDRDLTIANVLGGAQTFRTNGKAEKQQLEAGSVDRTASWEGPQLRIAYEVGRAGTLTYTYSLVPATKQLLIQVNFERRRGEPGPFDITLVYDPAASK